MQQVVLPPNEAIRERTIAFACDNVTAHSGTVNEEIKLGYLQEGQRLVVPIS